MHRYSPNNDPEDFMTTYSHFVFTYSAYLEYLTKNISIYEEASENKISALEREKFKVERVIDNMKLLHQEIIDFQHDFTYICAKEKAGTQAKSGIQDSLNSHDSECLYRSVFNLTEKLGGIENDINSLEQNLPITKTLQLVMQQAVRFLGKVCQSLMDILKRTEPKEQFEREQKSMIKCFETFKGRVDKFTKERDSETSVLTESPTSGRRKSPFSDNSFV